MVYIVVNISLLRVANLPPVLLLTRFVCLIFVCVRTPVSVSVEIAAHAFRITTCTYRLRNMDGTSVPGYFVRVKWA